MAGPHFALTAAPCQAAYDRPPGCLPGLSIGAKLRPEIFAPARLQSRRHRQNLANPANRLQTSTTRYPIPACYIQNVEPWPSPSTLASPSPRLAARVTDRPQNTRFICLPISIHVRNRKKTGHLQVAKNMHAFSEFSAICVTRGLTLSSSEAPNPRRAAKSRLANCARRDRPEASRTRSPAYNERTL